MIRQILSILTPADRILIGCLVALIFLSSIALHNLSPKGRWVRIRIHNQTYYQFPLSEDRRVVIKEGGVFMVVVIRGERAWVEKSNCPRQICVHSGKIGQVGQSIVCVPNRVVVSIEGSSGEGLLDAVTQ